MFGVINVIPASAGLATHEIAGQGTWLDGIEGWWKSYRLTAAPNPGWKFSHWEIEYRNTSPSGTESGTFSTIENPAGSSDPPALDAGSIGELDAKYKDGRHYNREIVDIRAYFYDVRPKVVTTCVPTNSGTTTGGGIYDVGSTVEISAKPKCSPWTFVKWKILTNHDDGGAGEISWSYDPIFSFVMHSDVREVFCTAFFDHPGTGKILYDSSSGRILSSDSGKIFYEGDLCDNTNS